MNRLWKFGHCLFQMGGVRRVSRLVELLNYFICACSVSIEAQIGENKVFFIGE